MGYYTAYNLHLSNVKPEEEEALALEIKKMHVFDDGDVREKHYSAYARWNDFDRDMLLLSTKFPGVLFTLYGDGEYSDDNWVDYFQDGKEMYCKAEIVYPEFDQYEMDYLSQSVDIPVRYSCQTDDDEEPTAANLGDDSSEDETLDSDCDAYDAMPDLDDLL